MTNSEIRAEVVEMINAGKMKVSEIVKYFKTYKPTANIDEVKEEAKELIAEAKATIKRGY
jgi:hypothetical protein